jgi:hypothetical protein
MTLFRRLMGSVGTSAFEQSMDRFVSRVVDDSDAKAISTNQAKKGP